MQARSAGPGGFGHAAGAEAGGVAMMGGGRDGGGGVVVVVVVRGSGGGEGGGGWERMLIGKGPVSSLHVVALRLIKVDLDVGGSLFRVCRGRRMLGWLLLENHLVVGEFPRFGHRRGAVRVWCG